MSTPNSIHKRYDAVATVGSYTNAAGESKKRFLNIGTLLEYSDGRLSLKLEALPVVPEWSGWVSFYESKPQGERSTPPAQQSPPQARQRPASPPPAHDEHDEEDIPF
jgi:hypothetical protein